MRSLKELMSLQGRVSLITGGTGHIGRAMADSLAELGSSIVLLDLSETKCIEESIRVQESYHVRALPLAVDLTDERAIRTVAQRVLSSLGRLDILVNCAALVNSSSLQGWSVPFEEQGIEAWNLALKINLTASFLLTQTCSKALRDSNHGSVINVGSIYGMVGPDLRLYEDTPMGNAAAYATSKGGLLQLTRWLAAVLAPKVRVNAIVPGGVSRGQSHNFQERFVERTPLRRMAREEDFKGAIAYLASDLSLYVTGQNIVVDGGWTVW